MKLGIDFGTTRTVVACADRGNYPVLSFSDDAGDAHDFIPSVVAERDGELRFGFDGEPWTLEAIGHELDLTRERVRQLEGQALSRLAALRELAGLAA